MANPQFAIYKEMLNALETYQAHLHKEIAKSAEALPPAVLNRYLKDMPDNPHSFSFESRMTGKVDTNKLATHATECGNVSFVYGARWDIEEREASGRMSPTLIKTSNAEKYDHDLAYYHADYENALAIQCAPSQYPALYAAIIKQHHIDKLLKVLHEPLSTEECMANFKKELAQKSLRQLLSIHRHTKRLQFQQEIPSINLPNISSPKSLSDYGIISVIEKLISYFWKARGHKVLEKMDHLLHKFDKTLHATNVSKP